VGWSHLGDETKEHSNIRITKKEGKAWLVFVTIQSIKTEGPSFPYPRFTIHLFDYSSFICSNKKGSSKRGSLFCASWSHLADGTKEHSNIRITKKEGKAWLVFVTIQSINAEGPPFPNPLLLNSSSIVRHSSVQTKKAPRSEEAFFVPRAPTWAMEQRNIRTFE